MVRNQLQQGVMLFNAGRFFDAHEALEDVWRAATRPGALRRHLQGLVQAAVAFHHLSAGNHLGARSVLKRALRNLEGAEASLPDLDFSKLRSNLEAWREYLESPESGPDREPHRSTIPELPKILPRDHPR